MMKNIDILNNIIKEHSDKHGKLVVGIDGYTGIGKTTLLNNLVEKNNNIIPVSRDDFIKPRTVSKKLLDASSDKSKIIELEYCEHEKIIKLIRNFKKGNKLFKVHAYNPGTGKQDIKKTLDLSKKILVVEGIFLFHPRLYNNIFDLKVFLEGDINKADERRVRREKKKWGKDYFPESRPDSLFRLVKIAFKRYCDQHKPKQRADVVIKI